VVPLDTRQVRPGTVKIFVLRDPDRLRSRRDGIYYSRVLPTSQYELSETFGGPNTPLEDVLTEAFDHWWRLGSTDQYS